MRALALWIGLCVAILPAEVWAQTLQCSNGFPIGGSSLFGVGNCNAMGAANVFSGLNCQFQLILDEVMSRMYCGVQHSLMYTLAIAMTLLVIVYAISFTFGIAELTAKELVTRLIKMALVWSFAMNASWGVGLAFNALVGSVETASTWAVRLIDPSVNASNIFAYLDQLLYTQLSGRFTAYGALLTGFIIALAWALFPIFALFMYLLFSFISILIRVLVTYLMGLTLIAFLIALAPLFVSFALFQVTFHLFENWLKYLISMALQIIIVMAAVAVWILVMSNFGDFFVNLYNVMRITDFVADMGVGPQLKTGVGVCQSTMQYTIFGYRLTCVGNKVVPPTAFIQYPAFIWYLFSNLVTMCIVAYAFQSLINQVPQLAQKLAGPADAPKLYALSGGATSGGVAQSFMPGKFKQLAGKGISSIVQSMPRAPNSPFIENFKQQAQKMVGDRE